MKKITLLVVLVVVTLTISSLYFRLPEEEIIFYTELPFPFMEDREELEPLESNDTLILEEEVVDEVLPK